MIRFVRQCKRVAISEAVEIKLSKLSNNVTEIVFLDSTFVDLMKTILNFLIALETLQREKFVATHILDILKDMMGSKLLEMK